MEWPEPFVTHAVERIAGRLGMAITPQQASAFLMWGVLYSGARDLLEDPPSAADARELAQVLEDRPACHALMAMAESADNEIERTQFWEDVRQQINLNRAQAERLAALITSFAAAAAEAGLALDANRALEARVRQIGRETLDQYFADARALWYGIEVTSFLFNPVPDTEAVPAAQQNDLQRLTNALFDPSGYTLKIAFLEEIGENYLADTARFFRYVALHVRESFAARPLSLDLCNETLAFLNAYERWPRERLAVFGPLQPVVLFWQVMLRFIMGSDPRRLDAERRASFVDAHRYMQQFDSLIETAPAEHALLRTWQVFGPQILWQWSMVESGQRRAELQHEAIGLVNRLSSRAVLEADPVLRTANLAMLALMPAAWKHQLGDFAGALEAASTARAFGQSYAEAASAALEPLLDALATATPDDEEEASQMAVARALCTASLENVDAITKAADLSMALTKAKLAEAATDFDQASDHYETAAGIEANIKSGLRTLFASILGMMAEGSPLAVAASGHDARARYFEAMAVLNRGDSELTRGRVSEANELFAKAKFTLRSAEALWEQAATTPSGGASASDARRQARICSLRARYCDARLELALAEQEASERRHRSAAKQFLAASAILEELRDNSRGVDEPRNIELLRASESFCRGRHLFEIDLDQRGTANVAEAEEALREAATRFENQGEDRWAKYVRALSVEYGVAVGRVLLLAAGAAEPAGLRQLLEQRASEAAERLEALGMLERAASVKGLLRGDGLAVKLARYALPKPGESLALRTVGGPLQGEPFYADASTGADDARRKKAGVTSLRNRLAELKDRRDKGRLSEGQYTDLAKSLEDDLNVLLDELADMGSRE